MFTNIIHIRKYLKEKNIIVSNNEIRIMMELGIIPSIKTKIGAYWCKKGSLDIFADYIWQNIRPIKLTLFEKLIIKSRLFKQKKLEAKYHEYLNISKKDSDVSRKEKQYFKNILNENPVTPREILELNNEEDSKWDSKWDYKNITIWQLSKEVGISKQTLWNWFKNKVKPVGLIKDNFHHGYTFNREEVLKICKEHQKYKKYKK
jgi:hypothetical protein